MDHDSFFAVVFRVQSRKRGRIGNDDAPVDRVLLTCSYREDKQMNYQMTAGEALQAFCRAWLVERDVEAAMAFIREDVDFVGTGIGESARGRDEMLSYLRQDMLEIPEPFTLLLTEINEQVIAEHVCNLSAEVTLKNSVYTWHVRGFFTMVMEGGGLEAPELPLCRACRQPAGDGA